MILKTSICFIRKMLECRMYFICTETGAVVFQPEALPQAESIAENENE